MSEKAHKHKSFWPVTPPVMGSFAAGCPGGKVLCTVLGARGIKAILLAFPVGRIGDRGDDQEFYVKTIYVPFLAV